MSPREFLIQFPNHGDFSRKSRIVLLAYYLRQHQGVTAFWSADMRRCFQEAMLPPPTDLNTLLASLSRGQEAPLLRSGAGRYAISLYGVNEVEAILPAPIAGARVAPNLLAIALPFLQRTIARVADPQRRDFLAEAISCLEVGARRGTVVLSWIATLDHMYDFVLAHGLTQFNTALTKQSGKLSKLAVAKKDDFGDMKESEFILVCRSAGLITADIRRLLDEKLGFRNSCAHPSSIAIGDSKVLSFVEDLIDNIVAKHPI